MKVSGIKKENKATFSIIKIIYIILYFNQTQNYFIFELFVEFVIQAVFFFFGGGGFMTSFF
jgi:hypothetical protein